MSQVAENSGEGKAGSEDIGRERKPISVDCRLPHQVGKKKTVGRDDCAVKKREGRNVGSKVPFYAGALWSQKQYTTLEPEHKKRSQKRDQEK